MKINAINKFNIIQRDKTYKPNNVNSFATFSNGKLFKPSVENLKAYYMPSFKAHEPYKQVFVYDRETKEPKKAIVMRDDVGDFTSFEIFINGEQKRAGFMHFKNEADCCEIRRLRTLDDGKKYSGIGTALVSCAIDESYYCHKNGRLCLQTEAGYAYLLSDYQSDVNPLPFYLKRGFVSPNSDLTKELISFVENNEIEKYPEKVFLVLTEEQAIKFREKYDKDSVYLED